MGERLLAAAQEALDHSEGKIDLRISQLSVSPVCETMMPDEIRATREKLNMSQTVFALVIGVSRNTMESWKSGIYMPDGAHAVLLPFCKEHDGGIK